MTLNQESMDNLANAEKWLRRAEFLLEAKQLNRQALLLSSGGTGFHDLVVQTESDHEFCESEASKNIELFLEAISAPEILAEPESAQRRAALILRAARAAAGLNLNRELVLVVDSLLPNGKDLDAAAFAASTLVLPIAKAAETLPDVVSAMKNAFLQKDEYFNVLWTIYDNRYYTCRAMKFFSGFEYELKSDVWDRFISFANEKVDQVLKKQKVSSFARALGFYSEPEIELTDLAELPDGLFFPWHKVLINNLQTLGYQVVFKVSVGRLLVQVKLPPSS